MRNNVASPKKIKKPPLSVVAVIITLDPTAGSRPSLTMIMGMALLIDSLAEEELRSTLKTQGFASGPEGKADQPPHDAANIPIDERDQLVALPGNSGWSHLDE